MAKKDPEKAKAEEKAKAKSRDLDKKPTTPDGLEAVESQDPAMTIGDYASREEAIWAAREFLRREAQDGLNRRLGINPKEIIGIQFLKSWRNYFADGKTYGFSKRVVGKLVAAGIAVLDGEPDPRSKKRTAQDEINDARARRKAKAALKADENPDAQTEINEKRARAKAKEEADALATAKVKARAEEDAKLEAEFEAELKADEKKTAKEKADADEKKKAADEKKSAEEKARTKRRDDKDERTFFGAKKK